MNWGLGHASRCIPIIRYLESQGAEVSIASDGEALELLQAEFPHLQCFSIPSYQIRYDHPNMVRSMLAQAPRILYAIYSEYKTLRALHRKHTWDAVISDNRYGCRIKGVPSIVLTHQLCIQANNRFVQWIANKLVGLGLSGFDTIWVPDAAPDLSLAGALSHNSQIKVPKTYLGLLTRMHGGESSFEYDVAVVLSGPEPQRTRLENQLLEQAMSLPHKFIFIQGKTQSRKHHFEAENIEVVSYFTSTELNEVLLASKLIVCRSGYSSLMDLAVLEKPALLIPTPGQTEQEYLSKYVREQGWLHAERQGGFDLEQAIEVAEKSQAIPSDLFDPDQFKVQIKQWLQDLSSEGAGM